MTDHTDLIAEADMRANALRDLHFDRYADTMKALADALAARDAAFTEPPCDGCTTCQPDRQTTQTLQHLRG